MAEEKKDVKKEEQKDDAKKAGSKNIFGTSWEDIALVLLVLASIFLVIIPRLDTNRSVDMFGGNESAIPASQYEYENGSEPYANIKSFYNNLLNPHQEDVVNEQGQVIGRTLEPSLVDEVRFRAVDVVKNIFYAIFFTSIFLSLLFGLLLYHNKVRLGFIKESMKPKKDSSDVGTASVEVVDIAPFSYEGDTNGIRNPRWEIVEKYYNSANQSDWRIAIMEADIMLYDLLESIGIPGESIGEKLKNTNKSQIGNLDLAWRAHKIRNELAHQGTNFTLSRTMVEEAIENFRKVFDEFSYI